MGLLNRAIGGLLDWLLLPFRELPAAVGLAVISLLATVPILLVFKATSDQARLAAAKRRIHAAILEIRLFNERPRFVLAAQGEALRHSLSYLRLTLVPLLWLALPLLLLMAHLQAYYGYRGLAVGEAVIVKVRFVDDVGAPVPVLEAGPGLAVETPLLWLPGTREANWRVAAMAPGQHELRLRLGDALWSKSVLVSGSVGRRSATRPSANPLAQLLHPSEPPLARGSPVTAIQVGYPPGEISLLGWRTDWVIGFLILTLLAAFALRGVLRVTF